MSIIVVLRLVWNSFSDPQYLFVNIKHALIIVKLMTVFYHGQHIIVWP